LGDTHAPQTYDTAAEVERLMCASVDEDERQAIREELRACRATPDSTSIAARHVKRRLRVVTAKRKAGPGPSGWRNSYIAGMGETKGGGAQLRLWSELWARGRIDPTVVPLWNGQVVAPKDCGPRSDDPSRRNFRPIALEEALLILCTDGGVPPRSTMTWRCESRSSRGRGHRTGRYCSSAYCACGSAPTSRCWPTARRRWRQEATLWMRRHMFTVIKMAV
jgi:hypothetical protein